jgi:plasmid stabilization system protein ParE
MGEIIWTEKASKHLQAIHAYIAADSPTYATRFIKSLIKSASPLVTMPRMGRIVPELENLGLREIIFHDYRIVYRIAVASGNSEILAVIHSARDFVPAFDKP